jgi:hypothetical protein
MKFIWKQIQNEIDIEASPKMVWDMLIDVSHYKDWNPFLVQARGQALVGSYLELIMSHPGVSPRPRRVLVTSLKSYGEFSWKGTIIHPFFFCGHNRFTLVPLAENQTRLIQEESFSGLLVPFYSTKLDRYLSAGFKKMLIALKSKVEG